MLKLLHRLFAIIATVCITIFMLSTLISELLFSHDAVVIVKSTIVCPGLFILVPSILLTGITGAILSKNKHGNIIKRKRKRMPVIAINGLIILIPAAIYLRANVYTIDVHFITVQIIEVLAGGVNMTMMINNIIDGRKLGGNYV